MPTSDFVDVDVISGSFLSISFYDTTRHIFLAAFLVCLFGRSRSLEPGFLSLPQMAAMSVLYIYSKKIMMTNKSRP
jgi:hypothetical protein